MTQQEIESQARELAERCAEEVAKKAGLTLPQELEVISSVLREINLIALLEDKARLDWLDKNRTAHIYNHFQYHPSTAASQRTWRTAITNAMKEDGK